MVIIGGVLHGAWRWTSRSAAGGLLGLGALDREDVPGAVAEREAVERAFGLRIGVERRAEVVGDGDLAWRGVELEVDVHLVAGRQSGRGAMLRAHADHVNAAHHRDRVPVGVAVDGDPDRRALARPTRRRPRRDLDAGRVLAGAQDRGRKRMVPSLPDCGTRLGDRLTAHQDQRSAQAKARTTVPSMATVRPTVTERKPMTGG